MNNHQQTYYHKMAQKGRLIPIKDRGELRGIITFFIGNGSPEKYTNREMWSVIEDNPKGDTCYFDHLVTRGERKTNARDAIMIWHNIKLYLKNRFPTLKKFRWTERFGRKTHIREI